MFNFGKHKNIFRSSYNYFNLLKKVKSKYHTPTKVYIFYIQENNLIRFTLSLKSFQTTPSSKHIFLFLIFRQNHIYIHYSSFKILLTIEMFFLFFYMFKACTTTLLIEQLPSTPFHHPKKKKIEIKNKKKILYLYLCDRISCPKKAQKKKRFI